MRKSSNLQAAHPEPTGRPPVLVPLRNTRPAGQSLGPQLVGPLAAAMTLGWSTSDLLRAVNDGTIAAFRFGEQVRFRPEDLARLSAQPQPLRQAG